MQSPGNPSLPIVRPAAPVAPAAAVTPAAPVASAAPAAPAAPALTSGAGHPAAEWLQEGRERERAGCMSEALERYDYAVTIAERTGELGVLAEALRRAAVLRHHRNESDQARSLCRRSHDIAQRVGNAVLAAEALNTLGGVDLMTGSLEDARTSFREALTLAGSSRELRARVEQNLGILANIQGDLNGAAAHYRRSLDAYKDDGDQHGCAIAYHNLGMVSADRGQFAAADCYYRESRALAEKVGDRYLRGLCLVNHAEVDVACQRFENARQNAEEALAIFDQLGVRGPKHDAYRVIGMLYRETDRAALAEARLLSAVQLAIEAGSVLGEAEAWREAALLYQKMGRNQEALTSLSTAHRLFRRLDARMDMVYVGGKVAELHGTYLAVVRAWGESIESSDGYTFGHCARVARNAVALARALGLDEHGENTVLFGAYLHDVGKVRAPHEILHKAGPLTHEETEILEQHPIWGIELLASVEFPWDIKPIIRWHHEHYDGSGYPDRLKGDEIPLTAQIVGILDFYDVLTTSRRNEPSVTAEEALERMTKCRSWWSDRVFCAFRQLLDLPGGLIGAP